LSLNVAKALSKKLDIRDYKKLASDRNNEILNYINPAGGGGSNTSTISLVNQSRSLLSQTGGGGYHSSSGSDPNKEFDYLVSNLRSGGDRGGEVENSEYFSEDELNNTASASRSSSGLRRPQSPSNTPHRRLSHSHGSTGAGGGVSRSSSAGRVGRTTTTGGSGGATYSPSRSVRGGGGGAVGGGSDSHSLRLLVDTLLKQSERTEERLTLQQRELASLRESLRVATGGANTGGVGSNQSIIGSPQRLLGTVLCTTISLLLIVNTLIFVCKSYLCMYYFLEKLYPWKALKCYSFKTPFYVVLFWVFCILTNPGGGNNSFQRGASSGNLAAATTSELEKLDWRLAIGEVSMNLRREVADKASREELYSAVRTEVQTLDERLAVSRKSARESLLLRIQLKLSLFLGF
jgi:hypothetical protein